MENYYIKNRDNKEAMEGAGSVFSTGKILEQCPAIILVFTDSERIDRSKVEDISAVLGIGGVVEHMMLIATYKGLGCLWIADTYFVRS